MLTILNSISSVCSVDVGTSEKIISGEIKVKSGVPVVRYTRNGILFSDGSELQADAIVLATGYDHDYRKQAAQIVGWDIASKLEDFWGVDGNGDMRGVMKPVRKSDESRRRGFLR